MDRETIVKRNHVQVIGDGDEVIVFAHGFGCDQQVWNMVIPAFKKDYKVILFDYVGAGKSDKSTYDKSRYSNLHGYAEDLIEVIDSLEVSNVTVVGHSVSGMISLLASIKRTDLFKKLIMIGPSPHYLNHDDYKGGFDLDEIEGLLDMMEKNYKEWARYLAPISMKNEERPELAEDFTKVLMASDATITRQFAEATFLSDLRKDICETDVPVVILQAQDDSIVPSEVVEYLDLHIKDCKIVWLTARGHNPHISDPEEVILHIKHHLS